MNSHSFYKSFFQVTKLQKFLASPLAGGVLLIICTIIAITLSNIETTSDWYHSLWTRNLTVGFDGFSISKPTELWINDALMAVFFFVVGLEIKREIVAGQLKSLKQASLPIAAAIGGMVVPAAIYFILNDGGVAKDGWGIPMATDIAFALGILSMMSSRVPLSLKIFLTALAIVDDLGAILVIALFYTSEIDWTMLIAAAAVFSFLLILNRNNVHKMRWYLFPSIILWILFLKSGIHATIAGVLIAMTMPSTAKYSKKFFLERSRELTDKFRAMDRGNIDVINNETQHHILQDLRVLSRNTISPVQRLEHALHQAIAFFIMPVFALANAGIPISIADLPYLASEQGLGIILGLVLGKPLGIMLFSFIAIKFGWSSMPSGANWSKLGAVACLGGIGFTMSIFIDNLAFTDPTLINYGKMSILVASVLAAAIGCLIMSATKKVEMKDSW